MTISPISYTPLLRQSTLKNEGALQTSKLSKIPVLLDAKEMELLIKELGNCSGLFIFLVQGVQKKGQAYISVDKFIENYTLYVGDLKKGLTENLGKYSTQFSAILTSTLSVIYSMSIGSDQELIKATKPIIQLQANLVQFSKEDKQFRPLTFGKENIYWGVHFSYPQLYQDPKNKEVMTVDSSEQFPNTPLFRHLQKWIRQFTAPTPFIIEEERVNSPIRLGKTCFSWINNHPQLIEKNIRIKEMVFNSP